MLSRSLLSSGKSILLLLFLFSHLYSYTQAQNLPGDQYFTYSPFGQTSHFSFAQTKNSVQNLRIIAVMVEFQSDENRFTSGNGRDVELTGTTLDRTPQDIPSVYLSKQALQNLFDDPSFSGFEISGGNLIVDHTLILPRTLSRSGVDFSGNRDLLGHTGNQFSERYFVDRNGLYASPLFYQGVQMSRNFNDDFRTRRAFLSLLIVNHFISAFDAYFTISLKQNNLNVASTAIPGEQLIFT